LFAPSEIQLPDYTGDHHLCFRAADNYAYIYSEEGRRFRREHPSWHAALERTLIPHRRTASENREILEPVVEELERADPSAREISARYTHPAVKASVLAFLVLDAQFTLFRQ
jgi:hypothetical protein